MVACAQKPRADSAAAPSALHAPRDAHKRLSRLHERDYRGGAVVEPFALGDTQELLLDLLERLLEGRLHAALLEGFGLDEVRVRAIGA